MSQLVLLGNEAVQALSDSAHAKHRRVLSHIQVVAARKRRGAAVAVVVPTVVRVEAGWDRTAPGSAFINRLRIQDGPLDSAQANSATAIRNQAGVSVADAHLGAVIQSATATRVTVITSDPHDVRAVSGNKSPHIVTI